MVEPHDDDATRNFPFAVEIDQTSSKLRADLHVRNIARRRRAYFRSRVSNPEPVRYPVMVG